MSFPYPFNPAELVAALRAAGMVDVPERFSLAEVYQEIPKTVLAEIEMFIRVFDRVTSREAWQNMATASEPAITRWKRPETCVFSAWDFHLPPAKPDAWQLIEFNDNGSGFIYAALLNRHYYELSGLDRCPSIEPPRPTAAFADQIIGMMRAQAELFFRSSQLQGLVLILDDADSLEHGRFWHELLQLRQLCRAAGWSTEIAAPSEMTWDGARLLWRGGEPVAFIVNRSTDFLWEAAEFDALRSAYEAASVYVAPNPFTYATRSDKRLLAWLSTPARDQELGISPEERAVLSAHVPETRLLRAEDVEELARARDDWYFKPSHGFASRGLLPGAEVGRTRLRRLLKKGPSYVAQRMVPKRRIETSTGVSLWVDLRVWAYRGECFLLSGRASRRPDRLDLSPPGGWLPTYAVRDCRAQGLRDACAGAHDLRAHPTHGSCEAKPKPRHCLCERTWCAL